MDSSYLQMEKVRGMDAMPAGKPRSLEAPEQKSLESMGYGDSTAKCESCGKFDPEQSMCQEAGVECDPGGHCSEHEAMEGGESPDADDSEFDRTESGMTA